MRGRQMEKAEMKGKKVKRKRFNGISFFFKPLMSCKTIFSRFLVRTNFFAMTDQAFTGHQKLKRNDGVFPFPWHQKKTKSNVDDKNDDNDDTFLLRR